MDRSIHPLANGLWTLATSELNKWVYLRAYCRCADEVAFRKAEAEAGFWLDQYGEGRTNEDFELPREKSRLLNKWLKDNPKTVGELRFWVAIHQRSIFDPPERKGAMLRSFPALSARNAVPDPHLTYLFYNALRSFKH